MSSNFQFNEFWDIDSDPEPSTNKIPVFESKFNFEERKGRKKDPHDNSVLSEVRKLQLPSLVRDGNAFPNRRRILSVWRNLEPPETTNSATKGLGESTSILYFNTFINFFNSTRKLES